MLVKLGIGLGSIGQKRVGWSRPSPPRITAHRRGSMGGRWCALMDGSGEGGNSGQEKSARDSAAVRNETDGNDMGAPTHDGCFLGPLEAEPKRFPRGETITASL